MPDKYKRDIGIEVLVGLFMFIILIALGVFTIVLSRQNFLQETYPIKVEFEEVGGLRPGDHVFLRGTQVGVVKATYLENHHVFVVADLDVPIKFHEGYKVEVISSSMLGGKMLKISEGPLDAPLIRDDVAIKGEIPVDMMKELSEAVARLREMSDSVAAGEGTLGKLLKDEQLYTKINEMMNDLSEVSARMANGKGLLGKLLSEDDTLYADLQTSIDTFRSVAKRLEQGEGTLGKLLSKDETIYKDIQSSVENVRMITEKVSSGEGTLGRLVEDDKMYAEAQKLLEELRAALDDMRETSPVTTFSTVLFGAF